MLVLLLEQWSSVLVRGGTKIFFLELLLLLQQDPKSGFRPAFDATTFEPVPRPQVFLALEKICREWLGCLRKGGMRTTIQVGQPTDGRTRVVGAEAASDCCEFCCGKR